MLISNLSSQGNSVVQWNAWLKTTDCQMRQLEILPGHSSDSETKVVDYEFNATPLNLMPHGTTCAQMEFFRIQKGDYSDPFELTIEAKDMYGKKYSCICRTRKRDSVLPRGVNKDENEPHAKRNDTAKKVSQSRSSKAQLSRRNLRIKRLSAFAAAE